jgi:hypothetical protein
MSEDEPYFERRLNGLLFDAANKTDELVRHKIAIIGQRSAGQLPRRSAAVLPQARRGAEA